MKVILTTVQCVVVEEIVMAKVFVQMKELIVGFQELVTVICDCNKEE